MPQKFEYKVTYFESSHSLAGSELQKLLNTAAKDDWEFHAVDEIYGNTLIIFKKYSAEYEGYNKEMVKYLTESK